ncbi:MAG: TM2 domain-containing protein [Bacteroidales bacterium]|nr:TM2 domain-containing protein [Bacteroidales bacterium]
MAEIFNFIPEAQGQEMMFLKEITADLSEDQLGSFATLYRARRRDPQMILLVTILGFVVVAGVQRFLVGQIGMGLLYLFTAGLCFIGTIIDLINYQDLAFEYNRKVAIEAKNMFRTTSA